MKILSSAYQKTILFSVLFFTFIDFNYATICTFTNGGSDNLWHNAANWDAGVIPDSDDDAIISAWTLTVDQDIVVNSLTVNGGVSVNFTHPGTAYIGDLIMNGGTLDSGNELVISNSLTWAGASSLISSSTIELSAACTSVISGTGNRLLYGRLVNYGSLTHTGGSLRFQTGGSFENYGTYTVSGAEFIINTGGNSFTNNGVFNKNNTNALNLFTGFDQAGTGQININAGSVILLSSCNFEDASSINVAVGASLDINAGTHVFSSTSSISGGGDIKFVGDTTTIGGAFTLTGDTEISGGVVSFNDTDTTHFTDLSLTGGTLQGSSPLVVNNTFNWTGTSSIRNTNSILLAGTTTGLIYSGGSKNLYTPLINEGTISHTGGNFRFYPGGSLQNDSIYTLNGPSNIYDNGGGSFDNNGFFEHLYNGPLNIQPDFNNNINGSVKGKGTIDFSNLSNLGSFMADVSSGTLNLTGTFDNGKTLEIEFDGADHGGFVVSGDISLSGDLNVTAVSSVPLGSYTILSSTTGTISGSFESVSLPSDFAIQYTSTEVVLSKGVLPVELIKFDAFAQRDDILLQWQTASELNSDKFLVEHSSDGQNFVTVGDIKAVGISSTTQDYQFIHEAPENGLNYYRLRQHNLDGSLEYSDLRVVSYYNYEVDLQVYPNPSHGLITIRNHSDKTFNVSVKDLSGRVVFSKAALTPGEASLDLRNLHKSMYIIEIAHDYYTYQEKLLILE